MVKLSVAGTEAQFRPEKSIFFKGIRKCPAADVAEMETFLILANVLKEFSLRIPPGDRREIGTQYEAGTGFIRHPKPYKVIAQKRE